MKKYIKKKPAFVCVCVHALVVDVWSKSQLLKEKYTCVAASGSLMMTAKEETGRKSKCTVTFSHPPIPLTHAYKTSL